MSATECAKICIFLQDISEKLGMFDKLCGKAEMKKTNSNERKSEKKKSVWTRAKARL
jgi:hypothetical protein